MEADAKLINILHYFFQWKLHKYHHKVKYFVHSGSLSSSDKCPFYYKQEEHRWLGLLALVFVKKNKRTRDQVGD